MWQDISKAILNVGLGTASVFMQVFQQIQSIVALVAGIITIIYLSYQIKKIRLDINAKQNQNKKDGK